MAEQSSTPPLTTTPEAARVFAIWSDYQQTHDPVAYAGQSVGIDEQTGRVFVGTMIEASDQARAAGIDRPLVFVRIGRVDALRHRYRMGGRWRRVT